MSTIITRTDYGGVDYVGEVEPVDNWDGKTWYKPSTKELYAYDNSISSYVLLNNFEWYIRPLNGDRGVHYTTFYGGITYSYGYRYATISTHSESTDLTSISSDIGDIGCTVSNGISGNARYNAGNGFLGASSTFQDYRIDTLSSAVSQGNYPADLSQSYGASNGTNDTGLVIAGTNRSYYYKVTLSTKSTSSDIPNSYFGHRGSSGNTCNGIYDRYLKCFGLTSGNNYVDAYNPITVSTGSTSLINLGLGINCYDLVGNGCSNDIDDRASIPGGTIDLVSTRSNQNRYITISSNSTSVLFSNITQARTGCFNSSNGVGDKAVYYYGLTSNTGVTTREYYTISTNSNSVALPNASNSDAKSGSSSNGAI